MRMRRPGKSSLQAQLSHDVVAAGIAKQGTLALLADAL